MKSIRVKHFIRPFLFGLGFLFLGMMAAHSWADLLLLLKRIHWPFFLLAMLVAVLGNLFTSFLMRELFNKYGVRISYSLSHKIYFYSQIAKYIPGKVWAFWYQATLLNTSGSTSAMLFVNMDLVILLIILTLSLASALILFTYSLTLALVVFGAGLLLSVWVTRYCYAFAAIRWALSYIKFFDDKLCTCHIRLYAGKTAAYYLLFSFTYLVSHWLMMFAAFGFSLAQSIDYTAYLTLAWIAGTLSFVVPGGVGVKEIVFVMLAHTFSGDISLEALAAIAIISRFAIMLQEVFGVGFAFFWNMNQQDSENKFR